MKSLVRDDPALKSPTYGGGLLKGLAITLRHLFSRSVTIQYPDEQDVLPPRSRGVIALKEENCTVCMLCARECPDWCIYIEGHKEAREPKEPGKRAKKFNVLDRFAIDYALCMYCGICVEVCPYDALFWSPEFEYAEFDVTRLTHEKERLNDWMYTVLPPAALDDGAQGPELKATAPVATTTAATPAPARTGAGEIIPTGPQQATGATPAPAATETPAPAAPAPSPAGGGEDPAAVRKKVFDEEIAKGSDPRVAEARAKSAEVRARRAAQAPPAAAKVAAPAGEAPAVSGEEAPPAAPRQDAPAAPDEPPAQQVPPPPAAEGEDPAAVRQRVYDEEIAKGSDPRVAEARAKSAEVRAKRGVGSTPAAKAQSPTAPAAAPRAPEEQTAPGAGDPAAARPPREPEGADEPGGYGDFTPEEAAAIRRKVRDEALAHGQSESVAEALGKTAEVRALQGFRRPDWK